MTGVVDRYGRPDLRRHRERMTDRIAWAIALGGATPNAMAVYRAAVATGAGFTGRQARAGTLSNLDWYSLAMELAVASGVFSTGAIDGELTDAARDCEARAASATLVAIGRFALEVAEARP